MKKVSIIVPVYNVEKYLEKCVKSLVRQTYENISVVLVNDGSTDNSGVLCDELAKKHINIHVIHKKTVGFPPLVTQVLIMLRMNSGGVDILCRP